MLVENSEYNVQTSDNWLVEACFGSVCEKSQTNIGNKIQAVLKRGPFPIGTGNAICRIYNKNSISFANFDVSVIMRISYVVHSKMKPPFIRKKREDISKEIVDQAWNTGRKIASYWSLMDNRDAKSAGHGTHVAGTALGKSRSIDTNLIAQNGVAEDAKVGISHCDDTHFR